MGDEPGAAASGAEAAADGPSPRSPRALFLVVGAYLTLLGGWRVTQVLPIVSGYRVVGEPDWLLPYLAAITVMITVAGVGLVITGLTFRTRARLAGVVGRASAALLAAFALLHTTFLIKYEDAFADGGFVFGFIHMLTLTRLPTTGTEAGILGYRIGMGFGMAVWFACCFLMFALTVLNTRRTDGPPAQRQDAR